MSTYNLTMEETFTVARSPEECFKYIVDFSTLSEWDPTITRSVKTSDGAVGLGSKFDVMLRLGLSNVNMLYEIIDYKPNLSAVLKGTADKLTAFDTVDVELQEDGRTKVTWRADIEFRGFMAKVLPLFEGSVRKSGANTIRQLRKSLEDRFEPPSMKTANRLADKLVLPGLAKFTRFGYSRASRKFKPVSADITGKKVLITGATSGLGLAAAKMLAAKGAHLILAARNSTKAEEAREMIVQQTGNRHIEIEIADLSLAQQSHALCDRLLKKGETIDVLINNAGALFNERTETAEGLEQSFTLLLLSPYILTERLMPLIQRSEDGRIINVSSGGMYSQRLDVDNLQSSKGKYDGSLAYARAKRGLVIMTEEWAKAYGNTGVSINSMHPGWADTPGVENALPQFYKRIKPFFRSAEEGADTIVWLAAATEAGEVSGGFFLDRAVHPTHMLPGTKEKKSDRNKLKSVLETYSNFEVEMTV